jgi:hypothetical protein
MQLCAKIAQKRNIAELRPFWIEKGKLKQNLSRIGMSYQQEVRLVLFIPFFSLPLLFPKEISHVFDFRYRNNRFTP